MYNVGILLTIAFIFLVIGFGVLCIVSIFAGIMAIKNYFFKEACASFAFILFSAFCLGICISFADKSEKYIEQETFLQLAIKDDYPVLLDGREVDAKDIDFSLYNIKVDTEKKKIFCTHK